jgi:hypothetical protein
MQHHLPRKWLLLPLALLAVGIFMAQKPKQATPSPADPGMKLLAPHKTTRPEIEAPDPNSGEEPDDDDDPNDGPVDIPTVQPGSVQLKVSNYEIVRVGAGSVMGKPDDWMLVVKGEGFFESEMAPIVHFNDSFHLGRTTVNQSGTELYALMTAADAAKLQQQAFQGIAVQNPGGIHSDKKSWAKLPVYKEQWQTRMDSAQTNVFERDWYVWRRQK